MRAARAALTPGSVGARQKSQSAGEVAASAAELVDDRWDPDDREDERGRRTMRRRSATLSRRRVRDHEAACVRGAASDGASMLTCVCVVNDAVSATSGNIKWSPAATLQVSSIMAKPGNTTMYGFHGSSRNPAPSPCTNAALASAPNASPAAPPRRQKIQRLHAIADAFRQERAGEQSRTLGSEPAIRQDEGVEHQRPRMVPPVP